MYYDIFTLLITYQQCKSYGSGPVGSKKESGQKNGATVRCQVLIWWIPLDFDRWEWKFMPLPACLKIYIVTIANIWF